ncbi:exodeoxyribonuclease VII large subunit [Portibacter marinus]|uniref:exodeoxyribonuclease VII large subunit n=1 Tax=Portibacter marinus TaxID=2898660 RepID=UPI001F3F2CF9|nr:exodeoxyribonuclease VII large subunit [Portibacter marinus]
METYSLFQLNEYIKRVIALNFQDSVWINAEISQVKLSRGNYYLDLIQKEENSEAVKAQASAIIWFRKVNFLEKKFKSLFTSIIDTGNEIRVKVTVQFSERYGFSLVVEDLDPSFTLGRAEMLKQEILNRLKAENLVFKNSALKLPIVLQRIAVISSETAAGYQDFLRHLQANSYGYDYQLDLYQAAMQGQAVEKEILTAMDAIEKRDYDCVVIIRGGGAKLDLSAFDNYAIGKRIAQAKFPVITGIGHDIDSSIADAVSHTDLKTPTAVADFLIEWNLHFESKILDYGHQLQMTYREVMQRNLNRLEMMQEQFKNTFDRIRQKELQSLNEKWMTIRHNIDLKLRKQKDYVESMSRQVKILSPQQTLKRGFSIMRQNGKVVKSISQINAQEVIESELLDGKIKSKITDL